MYVLPPPQKKPKLPNICKLCMNFNMLIRAKNYLQNKAKKHELKTFPLKIATA